MANSTTYSALELADYYINKANSENHPLTNSKLHSLLYIAYGYYLAYFDGSKLFPDGIKVWRGGPVVGPVFYAYKDFGDGELKYPHSKPELGHEIKDFLDAIYTVYSGFSADDLYLMTTQKDSPYTSCTKGRSIPDTPNGLTIDDDLIKLHYDKKVEKIMSEAA